MFEINNRIITDCDNDKGNIVHKFSVIDVKTGIGKLKNDRYDPVFDIMSDNFKYGTDLLYERIQSLFNVMLLHGISIRKINSSYITSIIKDKSKPAYDSNN